MARYIRIYDCTAPELQGNVLGFSAGIARASQDERLHAWLEDQAYVVTKESSAQHAGQVALGGLLLPT